MGPPELILLWGEDRVLGRVSKLVRLPLLGGVDVVQALDENEIGELLDDGQRVRDAPCPEGRPDAVNLGLDFPCDHFAPQIGQEEIRDADWLLATYLYQGEAREKLGAVLIGERWPGVTPSTFCSGCS